MAFTIYCDDINEADWFIELHFRLRGSTIERIRTRGQNPEVIEQLIAYDRPDIIVLDDEKPILVLEKTREVPTGHNVGQRMARLVRAVEFGIPTICFLPFEARKHGRYDNICYINTRLLEAFERMWQLHDTPVLAVDWICDTDGELVIDGSENDFVKIVITKILESHLEGRQLDLTLFRENQKAESRRRMLLNPTYLLPPPSISIESTATVLQTYPLLNGGSSAELFSQRRETVLYMIGMTEDNCRREDPYTGMQFIYDYMHCRDGRRPSEKYRNLCLHFPNIRRELWESNNPNRPDRKSSNWYLTANALIFADGVANLR
jgi:hypothetical protein